MKINRSTASILSSFALGAALLGAAALPSGCASDTQHARKEARKEASSLRSNLPAMTKNVDDTINSLVSLTAMNNTNRAKSFQEFSTNFAWLQTRAKEIGEQADRATADSQTFFRDWTREAMASRTPAERQAAEDSIATRKAGVETALSYLNEGKTKYRNLANTLRDLQNTLRGNLSQSAIDAAGPAVDSAIREANDVKIYISRLSEQIDSVLGIK